MKTILSYVVLAIVALGFAPAANAQDDSTEFPPVKDIYTHSWRDNWYIQLGAGAQMPIFERYAEESNFKTNKITALYEAGVGHWFSPYFGFRFRGQGGPLHYKTIAGWNKMKYANVNLEITWDMLNSLGGVNDKRVFSIIPYLGVGGAYAWDLENSPASNILANGGTLKENQASLIGVFGIDFRFRCSKRIDLYIDARATAVPDNFNNVAWDTGVDGLFSLSGGISINLGKEGRHVTKYTPYDCSGQIRELNGRINDLRRNLDETEAQLRAAQAQLPCPEVKAATVVEKKAPSVAPAIRFKFDSAKVSDSDKATLYDVAQMMKDNDDATIVIKGYADKGTGSEAYNKKLSERRANAVKDVLSNYGVEDSRMSVQAIGVESQPYSDNNSWNRVVIIEVE